MPVRVIMTPLLNGQLAAVLHMFLRVVMAKVTDNRDRLGRRTGPGF